MQKWLLDGLCEDAKEKGCVGHVGLVVPGALDQHNKERHWTVKHENDRKVFYRGLEACSKHCV